MVRIIIIFFTALALITPVSSARAWIITPSVEDEHDHDHDDAREHEEPAPVRAVPSQPAAPRTRAYVPPPAPVYYVRYRVPERSRGVYWSYPRSQYFFFGR